MTLYSTIAVKISCDVTEFHSHKALYFRSYFEPMGLTYKYNLYGVQIWENNMFKTPTEIYAVFKFNTQEIKNPFVKPSKKR